MFKSLFLQLFKFSDIPQDNYGNAEIGIGEDFQADIPDMIAPTGKYLYKC